MSLPKLLLALLIASGSCVCLCGAQGDSEPSAADLAQQKLKLIKKEYERLKKVEHQGITIGASSYIPWSKRWLETDLDLAKNRAERIAAYKAHVQRLQQLLPKEKLPNIPPDTILEYELLHARYLLSKAKD